MSWHAIEALDKAIEDTKNLLIPFNLGTWLRLALIVIFTGGSIGFLNPVNFLPTDLDTSDHNQGTNSELQQDNLEQTVETLDANSLTGLSTSSTSQFTSLIYLVGAIILVSIPLFFYFRSVFEFIYYQSLLDKDVKIRRNFKKNWFNGLQYFLFQTAYLLVFLSLIAGLIGSFIFNPILGVFSLLLFIPVSIVFVVFSGLIHDFVLVDMIANKENLVYSIVSIWPDLRNQWREVLVYLIVKFGLGLIIWTGFTTLSFGLLIPFVLIFGILTIIFGLIADILVLIPVLLGIFLFCLLLLATLTVVRTFAYFFVIEVYEKIMSSN